MEKKVNKVQQCAQCFKKMSQLMHEPFCTPRCEDVFLEHAPIEMIDETYKQRRSHGAW